MQFISRVVILQFFLHVIFNLAVFGQTEYLNWSKHIVGSSYETCSMIVKDLNDNVYTFGTFAGTVDLNPGPGVLNKTAQGAYNCFILKMDKYGTFIWVKTFDGDNGLGAVPIFKQDKLYFGIQFNGTFDSDPSNSTKTFTANDTRDFCLLSMDFNGNLIWAKQFDDGYLFNLDKYNNVYIAGVFDSTMDMNPNVGIYNLTPLGHDDAFLIKLNSSADFIWAKQFGGNNAYINNSFNIDFTQSDRIIISGNYSGSFIDVNPNSGNYVLNPSTSASNDIYLIELDTSGSFVWAKQFNCSYEGGFHNYHINSNNEIIFHFFYKSWIQPSTLDLDPSSSDYILTGKGSGVAKLDSNGNFIWAKSFGGNGNVWVQDMDMDSDENMYLVGCFEYGTVDIDPSAAVLNLTPAGTGDAFILKTDSAANLVWAKQFVGNDFSVAYTVIHQNNDIFISGMFEGTVDFDPNLPVVNITSDSFDTFILKFSKYPMGLRNIPGNKVNVYPNPSNSLFEIENPDLLSIKIFNGAGEIMLEKKNQGEESMVIDLSGFPKGIYYLEGREKNEMVVFQKLIKN